MRRGSTLEPDETGAGVPVLRHDLARDARNPRYRNRYRRARSGCGAAIDPGFQARLAGFEGFGEMSELPRDFRAQSRTGGSTMRVLRVRAARSLRRSEGIDQPGVAPPVQDRRGPRQRSRAPVVRAAVARAECAEKTSPDRHGSRSLPALLDV